MAKSPFTLVLTTTIVLSVRPGKGGDDTDISLQAYIAVPVVNQIGNSPVTEMRSGTRLSSAGVIGHGVPDIKAGGKVEVTTGLRVVTNVGGVAGAITVRGGAGDCVAQAAINTTKNNSGVLCLRFIVLAAELLTVICSYLMFSISNI